MDDRARPFDLAFSNNPPPGIVRSGEEWYTFEQIEKNEMSKIFAWTRERWKYYMIK